MTDNVISVSSTRELRRVLESHGVDTDPWGEPGAQPVSDLYEEIQQGECRIEKDPFCRKVWVTEVLIRQHGRALLEVEQRLQDGTEFERRLLPAEKMKTDEPCRHAARRCLTEELELDEDDIYELEYLRTRETDFIKSPSYPGLWSIYHIHRVKADVKPLPSDGFWTAERGADEHDRVAWHRWEWVDPDEV